MENVDKAMENRVWQRVQNRKPEEVPPLQRDNLKACILAAQENAVACRNLSLQLIGKQWEPLRRLEMDSMKMAHCLRGLSALRGETVKLTPLTRPRDLPWRALEKCFHRVRKLWEEMRRREDDPECGMVYRLLARQAEEQCMAFAELMGKLE